MANVPNQTLNGSRAHRGFAQLKQFMVRKI